jgi:hypothetical protein
VRTKVDIYVLSIKMLLEESRLHYTQKFIRHMLQLFPVVLSFVYISIAVGDPIKRERIGEKGINSINRLTPPQFVPAPSQDLDSQVHMSWYLYA